MSYQVFARKYRPQTFDDVVGQEHITRTLKNAILQNRLAHAYLFVGPRGTGKTSTARILSKCLCCVKAPTVEPCGICDPCREIAAGISLDVLEIDGASNNGVEQVRELRDNVRYAPTRGKYKIYIIDEVHMLSSAAFNALLKTLEEPPEHVKFIFATTEVQKVLPTILSRCQRFDLRRIPALLIAEHLQKISVLENIQLAPAAADALARGAEGGLRDAESMLDQLVAFCGDTINQEDVLGIFGFTAPETVAQMADHLLHGDASGVLGVLDAQSEAGKDLLRLLAELISHLRNLLVYQVNPNSAKEEIGATMLGFYASQSASITSDRLLELIDQFGLAENRMKWAPNKKLPFEIALIKAVQSLSQTTLTEVIDALTALREGDPAAVPAGPSQGKKSFQSNIESRASRPEAASAGPAAPARSIGSGFSDLKKAIGKPVDPPKSPAPSAKPEGLSLPAKLNLVTAKAAPREPEPAPEQDVAPAALPEVPPAAAKVEPEPPAAEIAVPSSRVTPLNGPRIWGELPNELRTAQRLLIADWVKYGKLISVENNVFSVVFPTDQRMVFDSLNRGQTRKQLESLLTKLADRSIALKMELRDDAVPEAALSASTDHGSSGDEDGRDYSDEDAPDFAQQPAVARQTMAPAPATSTDPAESFKNDPLIQKALKIFEGEIRSVEGPNGKS